MTSYARNAASMASAQVMGSELEKKLSEACSNEPWGASGTMLAEISKATFSYDDFVTVMKFIWRNLQLTGSLWRVVYKSLNLLEHVLRNGSDRVIEEARDHRRELKALQKFEYVDADGKNQGANVSERARLILELMGDDARLSEEREKARAARDRFKGVSAQDMGVEKPAEGEVASKGSAAAKGFSDDDFKFAADRNAPAAAAPKSSSSDWMMGSSLASYMPSLQGNSTFAAAFSTVSEYAQAANKQMQSMSTLAPSANVSKMLEEALSSEPSMPSSSMLYELGRATEQPDSYRIITSALWQKLLRSNQKPIVLLKALSVLEAVLYHGAEKALDDAADMRSDIQMLASFTHADEEAAGKVQAKAASVVAMLDDRSRLDAVRRDAKANGPFASDDAKSSDGSKAAPMASRTASAASSCGSLSSSAFDASDDFGAAFGGSPTPAPAPAPAPAPPVMDLLGGFDEPVVAPAAQPAQPVAVPPPAFTESANLFETAPPAATPAPPLAAPPVAPLADVASLSGTIGKISVNLPSREAGGSRRREQSAGITLGVLPQPAAAKALPAAVAPPTNAALGMTGSTVAASSPSDDLLGLMDLSTTISSAPAAPAPASQMSAGSDLPNLFEAASAAPVTAPQANLFEAPQANLFEAPRANVFEAPQANLFEAPQAKASLPALTPQPDAFASLI